MYHYYFIETVVLYISLSRIGIKQLATGSGGHNLTNFSSVLIMEKLLHNFPELRIDLNRKKVSLVIYIGKVFYKIVFLSNCVIYKKL